jgi:predicted helicase
MLAPLSWRCSSVCQRYLGGGPTCPYKEGLSTVWRVRKYNLDDLYVRFLRIGERRITATGRGIVCYISNYSYIDDPSFVVARQRLAGEFDSMDRLPQRR